MGSNNETLSPTIEADDPYAEWGDKEAIAAEFENTPEVDIEEVKRQLIESFGPSQQFSYMSHHGTVVEMMNLCTGIDLILRGGFEAAREWLSSYAVLETNEDTKDKDVIDTEVVETGTPENTSDKTFPDKVTKNNESKDANTQAGTARDQSIQQAVEHAKQLAEQGAESTVAVANLSVDQVKVAAIEESSESKVVVSTTATAIDQVDTRNSAQSIEIEKSTDATIENVDKADSGQTVSRENSVDIEKNEQIPHTENIQDGVTSSENSAATHYVLDHEPIVEKIYIREETVSREGILPIVPIEMELSIKVENDNEVVIIADASRIAEQENSPTPLPVFDELSKVEMTHVEVRLSDDEIESIDNESEAVTMDPDTQVLDTPTIVPMYELNTERHSLEREIIDEPMDVPLQVNYTNSDNSIEKVSIDTGVEETIIDTHKEIYIEEVAIIDEIANMVGEQPTEPPTSEAAYIAIEQAQKIEQSIVLLNHAKTGQECADRLQEIREELAGLLHVLGYKNVDMLVERLLKIYDIKTLRQFMVNLIIANSQAQQTTQTITSDPLSYYRIGRQVVALLINPLYATTI